MVYVGYLIAGVFTYLFVFIASVSAGGLDVVTAIAMLCAIIVVCTMRLVDAIKSSKHIN